MGWISDGLSALGGAVGGFAGASLGASLGPVGSMTLGTLGSDWGSDLGRDAGEWLGGQSGTFNRTADIGSTRPRSREQGGGGNGGFIKDFWAENGRDLIGAGAEYLYNDYQNRKNQSAQRKADARQYQYQQDAFAFNQANYRDRFKHLREDALAGGFHPLEALRAGGAQMAAPSMAPRVASNLAYTNSFDMFSDIFTGRAAMDRKSQALRDDLLRVEIDNARRSGELMRTAGATFPYSGTNNQESAGSQFDTEPGRRTVTNANHSESNKYVDPHSPDAEAGEQRYGDLAQEVAGVINIARDWNYSRIMDALAAEYGSNVADAIHNDYASRAGAKLSSIIKKHTYGKKKDNFSVQLNRRNPRVGTYDRAIETRPFQPIR